MSLLPRWWRRHFVTLEFGVAALVTAGFAYWAERRSGLTLVLALLADNRASVYGTLASIYGSLLGFAITAVAIVLGFVGFGRMNLVRRSSFYPDLWRIFTATIRAFSIATLVALAGLMLDREGSNAVALVYVNVFALSLATFRLLRCIWILEKVVKLVTANVQGD